MRIDFDADSQSWDITWQQLLLRLHLTDRILLAEHFGPAPSPSNESSAH